MHLILNRFLWLLKFTLVVLVLLLGIAIVFTLLFPDVICSSEMGYVYNGKCVYE